MSQPPLSPLDYISTMESPSNCAFCGRPLLGTFFRVQNKPACAQCAGRLAQLLDLNQFRFGPWMLGLIYGLAAAILGGFAWAVIVKVTHAEIGIVAIGIGYIVTRAIIAGSNGRRGVSIQVLAVILCLIGIAVGKGLIAAWVLWDQIPEDQKLADHPILSRVIWFLLAPFVGFQIYDLIWFGIAAMQTWRMARPIQLDIQGPFGGGQQPTSSPMPAPEMFSNQPPADQRARPAPRSTPLPQAVMITLVSAVFSAYVYARQEGWPFAAGSVLCILVHEMGHTITCLLYGLPASSPIFIPYVGAVINLRAQPPNAKVESVIGIAGPIGGLIAAAACYAWYLATHSPLAAELVQFGAVINLFNLVPMHPLDGGRIARGIATGFWAVFLLPIAAFCALAPKLGIRTEVAVLISIIAGVGVARTLYGRKGDYYNIPPAAAWFMGFLYLAVAGALLWMWAQVQGVVSIF